jgi:hypothetical protein
VQGQIEGREYSLHSSFQRRGPLEKSDQNLDLTLYLTLYMHLTT